MWTEKSSRTIQVEDKFRAFELMNSAIEVHLNMGMAMLMRVSETDAMIVVAHQASEKWNVDSQKWTYV